MLNRKKVYLGLAGFTLMLGVPLLVAHVFVTGPRFRTLTRDFPAAQHTYEIELADPESGAKVHDAADCRLVVRMAAHCRKGPCGYESPAVQLLCGDLRIPWSRAKYLGEKHPTLERYDFRLEHEGKQLTFRKQEGSLVVEDPGRVPALRFEGKVLGEPKTAPLDCEPSYVSFMFMKGGSSCTYDFLGVDGR